MKLELEVLASTNIKRKKPWPKIVWVGEVCIIYRFILLFDIQFIHFVVSILHDYNILDFYLRLL